MCILCESMSKNAHVKSYFHSHAQNIVRVSACGPTRFVNMAEEGKTIGSENNRPKNA